MSRFNRERKRLQRERLRAGSTVNTFATTISLFSRLRDTHALNTDDAYRKHLWDSCETDYDRVLYDALISGEETQCMGDEGPCTKKGRPYRQNTSYDKAISNWRILCPECIKTNEAYWKERWDEYYSGLL